ncbi:MAG: histidine triad family protein [Desulfonauticus sp.]|jgi:histidine triad (HIT) family protein|nr:histidine triad family protein [Desulfonauticus sp.]
MEKCIFCEIVAGNIPCTKIYESENILAFLDIAPVNPGHTLVIPKQHYPTLLDLPPALGQELLEALQKVAKAIKEGLQADGINLGMNNYRAAGQLVFHAHFHLIPRYEKDGLTLWPQQKYESETKMQEIAQQIINKL